MVTNQVATVSVRALAVAWAEMARNAHGRELAGAERLRVFLDCDESLQAFIRPEFDDVRYVSRRCDADVCVRVTPEGEAGSYHVAFVGMGTFELIEAGARLATK